MAIIGTMAVNIVARTEKFLSGLNAARNAITKFTSKFGAIQSAVGGALGVAWLKNALTGYAEAGSQLKDLSTATGVTVENLSFLKYAAGQTGASIENLQLAFKTMIKQGLDPNRFYDEAAGLAAMTDATERGQRALKLFGKQGLTLLPMIKELPQLRKEFELLGGPMSTEAAENAHRLGDSWGRLKKAMGGVRNAIASTIAPTLIWFNDLIANNSLSIKAFIKQHATLTKWLGGVAAAFIGLTPALWAFNQVMTAINTTIAITQFILKSGLILKALALLVANPAVFATLAGLAAIGYGLTLQPAETPATHQPLANNEHLKEQRRTNDILSLMVRRGSSGPAAVLVAGGSE